VTEGTESAEMNESVEERADLAIEDAARVEPVTGTEQVEPTEEFDPTPEESSADETPATSAPEELADATIPAPEQASESDETDDVATAIAEAGANLADDDSFDSIAPGTVAQDAVSQQEGDAALTVPVATTVSWIPFLVYDALWLIFAGLLIWQLAAVPATNAMYESELYSLAVLGGVVLAAVGPILILAVWIGSWGKEGARKGSLLVSALIRGSIATLAGVVIWWGALLLLDQLRLGRLL
jgi:hypothetical protein